MIGRIVDLLVIVFISLNVLAFEIPVLGISLRYIVFALILPFAFVANPQSFTSAKYLNFISIVIVVYSILIAYSFLLCNDIEKILIFIRPLLVLFTIPAFNFVFSHYGTDRYMKVFSLATFVMIIIFIYVFVMSLLDFNYAKSLNDEMGLIFVNVYQVIPRVVIKTFVFVIPFSVYIMNKLQGIKLHVFFVIMMLITLLSQTLGIVLTLIFLYFYILYSKGKKKDIIVSIIILFIIYSIFHTLYIDEIISSKEGSSDIKFEQISNIFKDLDSVSFLFGRGLGCDFKNFDSRYVCEQIIEVAAVQIYQMGGCLFSFFILYVYLYPARFVFSKCNNINKVLAFCQIGIFCASMFNPYLWGGGTGLLFVAMIEAVPSIKNKTGKGKSICEVVS